MKKKSLNHSRKKKFTNSLSKLSSLLKSSSDMLHQGMERKELLLTPSIPCPFIGTGTFIVEGNFSNCSVPYNTPHDTRKMLWQRLSSHTSVVVACTTYSKENIIINMIIIPTNNKKKCEFISDSYLSIKQPSQKMNLLINC